MSLARSFDGRFLISFCLRLFCFEAASNEAGAEAGSVESTEVTRLESSAVFILQTILPR